MGQGGPAARERRGDCNPVEEAEEVVSPVIENEVR